jgi:hypothetical protein
MKLRHALGTIVCKHQSYVLRIAVANLIREFLTGKFDRHLFWPPDTPAATFNDFPLAQSGDATWLANVVWYLSDVNATVVSRAEYVMPWTRGSPKQTLPNKLFVGFDGRICMLEALTNFA